MIRRPPRSTRTARRFPDTRRFRAREGAAVSWHVQEVRAKRKARPKTVDRVTFNASTKQAVTEAMKAPRALDTDLIDAYRARRALDYLVGFTLSPVLWRKIGRASCRERVCQDV